MEKEKKNGIMALRWGTCRYILNTDLTQPEYCCEPVKRGAYCEKHARLCYQTPKKTIC